MKVHIYTTKNVLQSKYFYFYASKYRQNIILNVLRVADSEDEKLRDDEPGQLPHAGGPDLGQVLPG